mmetsp:Transcript_44097/g.99640  ORF Transcript_44097/g.99640 Transcript_44097/m.99640 type:complete len:206 (-) Transcript_44097:313-930(-)
MVPTYASVPLHVSQTMEISHDQKRRRSLADVSEESHVDHRRGADDVRGRTSGPGTSPPARPPAKTFSWLDAVLPFPLMGSANPGPLLAPPPLFFDVATSQPSETGTNSMAPGPAPTRSSSNGTAANFWAVEARKMRASTPASVSSSLSYASSEKLSFDSNSLPSGCGSSIGVSSFDDGSQSFCGDDEKDEGGWGWFVDDEKESGF